jgi:hypothetical protein
MSGTSTEGRGTLTLSSPPLMSADSQSSSVSHGSLTQGNSTASAALTTTASANTNSSSHTTIEPQRNPFDELPPVPSMSSTHSTTSNSTPVTPVRGITTNVIQDANVTTPVIPPSLASTVAIGSSTPLPARSVHGQESTSPLPSHAPVRLQHQFQQLPDLSGVSHTQASTTLNVPVPEDFATGTLDPFHTEDDDHTEPSSAANTMGSLTNPASSGGTSVQSTSTPPYFHYPASHQLLYQSSHQQQPLPSTTNGTGMMSNSISRFIDNTRRRFTSSTDFAAGTEYRVNRSTNRSANHYNRGDDDDDDDIDEFRKSKGTLISGLLHKLGRNGKWQTRWFETDGECLSYYKNAKRTKLLATLDLDKVSQSKMLVLLLTHFVCEQALFAL